MNDLILSVDAIPNIQWVFDIKARLLEIKTWQESENNEKYEIDIDSADSKRWRVQ